MLLFLSPGLLVSRSPCLLVLIPSVETAMPPPSPLALSARGEGISLMPRLFPCLAGPLVAGLLLFAPGCRALKDSSSDNAKDASGQQTHSTAPVRLPSAYSYRIAPYVFLSDYDLKTEMSLLRDLASLRDQVCKELQLPMSDEVVYVYLFEDAERYRAYMESVYPKRPRRRAFFIAQERALGREDLMVFTSRGDRLQQDLRHELTHALLHSVLQNVPIWLDEGLAEYFELPPDRKGINETHLSHFRPLNEAVRPELARLEKLTKVEEMSPAEYREAWAWAHFMLRSTPENRSALLGYLQQLRTNANPGPLRPKLAVLNHSPEESLVRHVQRIEVPSSRTPTVKH